MYVSECAYLIYGIGSIKFNSDFWINHYFHKLNTCVKSLFITVLHPLRNFRRYRILR